VSGPRGVVGSMSARIYKFPKGQKKAEPGKPAKAEKPAAAARRYKVLLVAGQDKAREALAEALAKSGCEVTHYRLDARYYPALLLDLFEKNRFDVVVPTNLGIPFVYLPDLVGLTQKFGRGAGIAVVSGWVQDDFVAEVAKLPRAAFFTAPVKLEEFTNKIRELAAAGPDAREEKPEKLPRVLVLLADAEGNQMAQFFLDWLVARYREVLDIRGAVHHSAEELLRIASVRAINLFVVNFTTLWVPGPSFRGTMDFARHLKARFGRPVVMLSGFEDAKYKGQAIAAGVDAYFRLPMDLEKVGHDMDRLLNVK
jgi:DNA-binding NarL/FixJ family response regulator